MANRYWATNIDGGSGSLANIDPTDTDGSATALVVGDSCKVVTDDAFYEYLARSSSVTENQPDIVVPNTNPGTWWWELIEVVQRNTGMINQLLYENMPGAF